MTINLIDKKKKKHKFPVGFSFWYLFFGPIYTLFRKRIVYSLIVIVYHFLLIPKSIIAKFYTLFHLDEQIISILTYPHNNFDIVTYLIILLVPHIIIAIFIDNHYLKVAINQQYMLPATDVDLEKIAKKFPKYKDLPIDLSFVEKQVFLPNEIKEDEVFKVKSPLDLDKSNLQNKNMEKLNKSREKLIEQQLNILYGKFESGFISEEELIKEKHKILENYNLNGH